MGFAKKLGQTYLTEYHPLNPAMHPLGAGSKLKGYVCTHGERLIEGTLELEYKIARADLPRPWDYPSSISGISPALCVALHHLCLNW